MPVLSDRRRQQIVDLLLANLVLVATVVLMIVGAALLHSFTDNLIALNTIPLLAATLGVTATAIALHPEATWRALGLPVRNPWALAWGVLLGAVACGIAVTIAVSLDWARWGPIDPSGVRFDWRETRAVGLALLVIGAFAEELFLRGLLLQFLARAIGAAGAVAVTSAIFAILHGTNPAVTGIAQFNTALFGVLFGLAVVRGRSLWLACGLHLGWNVAQVALGVNNSGITIRLTDLHFESRGPVWLAGGDYGLEGGILATGVAAILAVAVWVRPGPRGSDWPFWKTDRTEETGADAVAGGMRGGLLDAVDSSDGSGPGADSRSAS